MLAHYKISKPTVSYHEFNKEKQTKFLINELKSGKLVALISDAGTPGISDPGFYLIRASIEAGIKITPVPGATAFVPALVISGLPLHRFVFEGFPPVKKGRKTFFERLASEERTIILYESPHKLMRTLSTIVEEWGNRQIVIVRELTKKFEEFLRGDVEAVIVELERAPRKGEFVLIIEGASSVMRKKEKQNES